MTITQTEEFNRSVLESWVTYASAGFYQVDFTGWDVRISRLDGEPLYIDPYDGTPVLAAIGRLTPSHGHLTRRNRRIVRELISIIEWVISITVWENPVRRADVTLALYGFARWNHVEPFAGRRV